MSAPAANPLAHPAFTEIDRQFAALMERLAGGGQPDLALAAALASHRAGAGGPCAGGAYAALREPDAGVLRCGDESVELKLPERESWLERLRASRVVGAPGEFKPLILDAHGRLFLHRCWEYEQQLTPAVHAPGEASGEAEGAKWPG
jgi:exodeoxyribonuclease V alpha subunit